MESSVYDKHKERYGTIVADDGIWVRCKFKSHPVYVAVPKSELTKPLSNIVSISNSVLSEEKKHS